MTAQGSAVRRVYVSRGKLLVVGGEIPALRRVRRLQRAADSLVRVVLVVRLRGDPGLTTRSERFPPQTRRRGGSRKSKSLPRWEHAASKCDGYGMCSVLRAEAPAGLLEARSDRFRGYSALARYFTGRQSLSAVGQEGRLTRTEVEGCSFTPRVVRLSDVVEDAICDAGGWNWWIPACLDEDVNQPSPCDPGVVAHTAPSVRFATKRRTL